MTKTVCEHSGVEFESKDLKVIDLYETVVKEMKSQNVINKAMKSLLDNLNRRLSKLEGN